MTDRRHYCALFKRDENLEIVEEEEEKEEKERNKEEESFNLEEQRFKRKLGP